MLLPLQLGALLAGALHFDANEMAVDAAMQIMRAAVLIFRAVYLAHKSRRPLASDRLLNAPLQIAFRLSCHVLALPRPALPCLASPSLTWSSPHLASPSHAQPSQASPSHA